MKKTNLRKSKGITLIALVITIIVLLILAGIAISMLSGQNGILTKAADAKTKTGDAQKEEEKVLKDYEDVINESTGSVKKITFKKQGTGDLANGDEVTASNGEAFYVMGGDEVGRTITSTTQKVLLLSKYNLKKEGTEITLKQDTTGADNMCAFSSANYWSSETSSPVDLNNYQIPEGVTSIVTTAKAYGQSLGVTGRLITIEEIISLGGDLTGNPTTSGTKNCPDYINTQRFWFGSANVSYGEWSVYATVEKTIARASFSTDSFGVRPVIEVSKDLIK